RVALRVRLLYSVGAFLRARARAGRERALVEAEAHGAALLAHQLLLDQQVDHFMSRARVELPGVGSAPCHDMARDLDDRRLHAETDAEVRHLTLAGEARGFDLAFDA